MHFVEVPKTGSTSIRAILGKAWKPHLNLWQIKQLMETHDPLRRKKEPDLGRTLFAVPEEPEKTGSNSSKAISSSICS